MQNTKEMFLCMIGFLIIHLSGCGTGAAPLPELSAKIHTIASKEMENAEHLTASQNSEIVVYTDSKDIAELYRDIYEQAYKEKTLDSMETIAAIVNRLGEYGFTAADSENRNRIDMVNWEQVEGFCQYAGKGDFAAITIFCIANEGGFIRFDLTSTDGAVTVDRSVLTWKDNAPEITWQSSYPAYDWVYTEEGYLFFDEYSPEGYDGAPGYTAIRIKPLDAECRRLTQSYIAPVGYGGNNMFLLDWTEENFDALDFYDLFPRLYPVILNEPSPYEPAFEGNTWYVPENVFETVIQSCFAIDMNTLRAQTDYDPETRSYIYNTRSFYDAAVSPNLPYPEVIGYTENADQTITLTINAVLPKQHLSQAFCHEVVIRMMENGKFQYVSNHVIYSNPQAEMSWYTDRLSEEERIRIYQGSAKD